MCPLYGNTDAHLENTVEGIGKVPFKNLNKLSKLFFLSQKQTHPNRRESARLVQQQIQLETKMQQYNHQFIKQQQARIKHKQDLESGRKREPKLVKVVPQQQADQRKHKMPISNQNKQNLALKNRPPRKAKIIALELLKAMSNLD